MHFRSHQTTIKLYALLLVLYAALASFGQAAAFEPFSPEKSPPAEEIVAPQSVTAEAAKPAEYKTPTAYNVLLLVDASRSMTEKTGESTTKIDSARSAVKAILKSLPPKVRCGLRTFGEGSDEDNNVFGSLVTKCRQTAVPVPPGVNNHNAIQNAMASIRTGGMSPLTYALAMAIKSELNVPGQTSAIVIITDGADTCNGNPSTMVRKMSAAGSLTGSIYVLSFVKPQEPQASSSLDALAEAGGGAIYDYRSIDKLLASIGKFIHGEAQAIKEEKPVPWTLKTTTDAQ